MDEPTNIDQLDRMIIPNEIICEIISKLTDLDTVLNLLESDKLRDLTKECVEHLSASDLTILDIDQLEGFTHLSGLSNVFIRVRYESDLRKIRHFTRGFNEVKFLFPESGENRNT